MAPKRDTTSHIPLVGILGGIASGKSFVGEQLERKGAAIVSADRLAHEVLKLDEVKKAARERWGDQIFDGAGEIARDKLAGIVFAPAPAGPRERKVLEELTHPRIGKMVQQEIERIRRQGAAAAIVLDVPLLAESGWNKFCDRIVFVDAAPAVRQQRARCRGWSAEDLARRETVQQSLESKRALADVVLDNSGTAQETQLQIDEFWRSLGAPASP
jgi:dephospho-CoA kinase